ASLFQLSYVYSHQKQGSHFMRKERRIRTATESMFSTATSPHLPFFRHLYKRHLKQSKDPFEAAFEEQVDFPLNPQLTPLSTHSKILILQLPLIIPNPIIKTSSNSHMKTVPKRVFKCKRKGRERQEKDEEEGHDGNDGFAVAVGVTTAGGGAWVLSE
ncbi:hypothetical protein PIB30_105011, partial [Stylosanthes scabra]|nr:hypothetical protein [Stylosanthes scabra]